MTKRSVKTKIDPKTIGINPLSVSDFIIRVNKIEFKNSFTKDGDIILPSSAIVEYDSCTKVYNKSEHRLFAGLLSPASKSLFLWLIYEVDYNLDYIWINKTRYMEENRIKSINTYKSAIDELTRYCAIYPVANKRDVYWISPKLFFNGNRITKYPNNIQIVNDSTN